MLHKYGISETSDKPPPHHSTETSPTLKLFMLQNEQAFLGKPCEVLRRLCSYLWTLRKQKQCLEKAVLGYISNYHI